MILCCGEALIDMLPRQLPDGGNVFLPVAGGAVFNTAIALGRLGAPAGFLSGMSHDMFGDILRQTLDAAKVDTSLCVLSDRPTTLAFVKLTDGQAQYEFYDDGSAGRMLAENDLPVIPEAVEVMHFGAISLIPEPCGSAYESLALAEAPNRVISLDPNIRPNFIDNPGAHMARVERMIAVSDIVKVSDEDLAWLAGAESAIETIGRWLSGATCVVAVTHGEEGVEFHTKQGVLKVPARTTKVADTIGAGDAFNGGFLCGLSQSSLLSKEALRQAGPQVLNDAANFAVQVAAITVSRPGADAPWASEVER